MPAAGDRVGTTRAGRPPAVTACSAASTTLGLLGSTSTPSAGTRSIAAAISPALGLPECPAATTSSPLAASRNASSTPLALDTTASATAAAGGASAPDSTRRSDRSRMLSCMSLMSTPEIAPMRTARDNAAPGSSVWTCTLNVGGSPTTSSESPSGSISRSRATASTASPSTRNVVQYRNSESSTWRAAGDGAAAAASGSVVAGSRPSSPATAPRTSSTRPAAPASTTPASRRTGSISRVASTVASPASSTSASWRSTGSPAACSARSAIARIAVSIVPSTGWRTAPYAASDAPRNARATAGAVITPASALSDSAKPRIIWERITPLLPRAPISAALLAARAIAAGDEPSGTSASPSARRPAVSARLLPVSPSGTGYTLRSLIRPRFASSAACPPRARARARSRGVMSSA